MSEQVLDNPIWESLASRHRALALRAGEAARFPAQVAPFLGVPEAGAAVEGALDELVPAGDTALVLGRAPTVSARWELKHLAELAQMICDRPVEAVDGPEIVALDERRREDVLALTALVYPHYFRPRTPELGRYFGIYQDGRLAAMIGERMGMDAYTEISAVCTHPDFNGRGYARRLLVFLSNDNHARGLTPFLHVSQENPRAVGLYEQNGYRLRREIPFWSLRRADT
ncbi:GNAT family N-acetyltransferase [Lysobacter sp. 5GHs7-4]|uniref:GNAT family N-acetyltransferase n=1 Tax=Lysobacter sp. 5GHs7-4 TaxID=2904253 RepID=UPI001E4C9E1A|nr:GNAT family N-acetyltransferase [Lysobacter sp. 5GHs7-4]UHQ22466.1 GNAT family N-acetyltransferase [Lysobacter sp. 5GHs7-4]